MKKTSQEYAEKLANEDVYPVDKNKTESTACASYEAYIKGYLRAVEETNVEELVEVLVKINSLPETIGHAYQMKMLAAKALKKHQS